ncbi:MAG: EAL domain-containing protein [Gammaproteobacteria bacterium]|nr:EAL domain-containing protein [Gammaproteobacteria bacterium]
MAQPFYRKQLWLIILLTLLWILIGTGLSATQSFRKMDLLLYDAIYPVQSPMMSDQVLIVAIDDASLRDLGRWPWSRRVHADLIDKLSKIKPKAIGLDILFSEAQNDDIGADSQLAQSIMNNGRVVLVLAPMQKTAQGGIDELVSIPELVIAAKAMGHVDIELDSDGLNRRFFLYAGLGDARWPAFSLALLQISGQQPLELAALKKSQVSAPANIWQRQFSLLTPYSSHDQRPRQVSYTDVLAGRVDETWIRDKYVLIGATAAGLGDAISTPAAPSHERMPGIELNAHILNGLLQGHILEELGTMQQSVLTAVLLAFLLPLILLQTLRKGLLAMITALVIVVLFSTCILWLFKVWFAPFTVLLLLILAWPVWSLWQIGEDIRLRNKLLSQLSQQRQYNNVTGLPNHSMLEKRLHELDVVIEPLTGMACLMLLHINWPGAASVVLGKPMANPVLQAISNRLNKALNVDKFIAHLNGDDFAVLIYGIKDQASVLTMAQTLLAELKKPLKLNHRELLLSPQIGVSVWPDDGEDGLLLLRNAYTAMFKSRIDYNEHVCVYSQDVERQLEVRSRLEQALIHALENNEFEVYYQPQFNANSGQLVGVEALLRWENPVLGRIGPETFIPVAEHVGLIKNIGDWVLSTACLQLWEWQQNGLRPIRLAVNVSPLQFIDQTLVTRITSLLKQVSIRPEQLELEITESLLIYNLDNTLLIMQKLKQQGVELAIDDFGTGYSSLSNLRHFPLNRLKIDQSFIRDIGKDDVANEIALTIITMGKRLGLKVIAEGVEKSEQAEFLRENGCDEFQGYLYSKPLPANDMTNMLQNDF